MADRRTLTEGLKPKVDVSRDQESKFVFGDALKPSVADTSVKRTSTPISRVPFTTRVRSDLALALKRASLERQLDSVEPNTVQEIHEEALESWLKANGYFDNASS